MISTSRTLPVKAEIVIPEEESQVSRDTKDNKFIAAAEASNADYLVSEDRDLLDLRKREETRIVTANQFLKILRTFRKAA